MNRTSRISRHTLVRISVFLTAVFVTHAVAAQSQPQLRLTAEIIDQSFCSLKEQTSLELKLRLRYTNGSDRRVIVYKGHDLFYQTKIRTEENSAAEPYEVLLLNMRYFDEELERIEARSPTRVFVKLAPGASFERELITGIGVADGSIPRSTTAVRPGRHILQLIVSTWYQSPQLAEKLRQQWQREGFLWSQPLSSVPLKLQVEKPSAVAPCR